MTFSFGNGNIFPRSETDAEFQSHSATFSETDLVDVLRLFMLPLSLSTTIQFSPEFSIIDVDDSTN